jgi:hypothetical protein
MDKVDKERTDPENAFLQFYLFPFPFLYFRLLVVIANGCYVKDKTRLILLYEV